MTTDELNNKIQVPPKKFDVGDIVRIIDHDIDDQNGIHVISGIKLNYFSFFRTHKWEYCLDDKYSSSGWFDEEKIESATPQNEDEADYITGGNIPFRAMMKCPECKAAIVADLLDCPKCGAFVEVSNE